MQPHTSGLKQAPAPWRGGVFILISLALLAVGLASNRQVVAELTEAPSYSPPSAGIQLWLQPEAHVVNQAELAETQQVLSHRLAELHLAGSYEVRLQGSQVMVDIEFAGRENLPYLASILSSVGQIEFIDGGPTAPPVGQRLAPDRSQYPTLFTGQEIQAMELPGSGEIFYRLSLEAVALERFSRFLEAQPGSYLCMVVDGEVVNCSRMYHYSQPTLEILPGLSSGQAVSLADLAVFLRSGPLPVAMEIVEH